MNCPVCGVEFEDSVMLELHVNAHFGTSILLLKKTFSIYSFSSFQMQMMMNTLQKRFVILNYVTITVLSLYATPRHPARGG